MLACHVEIGDICAQARFASTTKFNVSHATNLQLRTTRFPSLSRPLDKKLWFILSLSTQGYK